MRPRRTLWLLLAGLAGPLAPVPAVAQNLLTNPDFASDTSAWTNLAPSQGSLSWDGLFGFPAAGSALLTVTAPTATGVTVAQHLPVTAGRRYGLRAYRLHPTQATSGCGRPGVRYYSASAPSSCGGSLLGSDAPTCYGATSGWEATPRFSSMAPAGAVCARVDLYLSKFDVGGTLSADFDHVFFGPPVKGDLDGFGDADLVFKQIGNPVRHEVWLMNGVTRQATVPITPDAPNDWWELSGVDDFNDDGIQDLVFWDNQLGEVRFWLMDQTGTHRSGNPVDLVGASPLPVAWRIAATSDFDHDRRPDLLWRNTSSQQLVIWLMNGVTKTGSLTPSPSQAVDANWSVVGARDFDGDANTDLLWYNSTSGKIVMWFMDAGVVRTTGQFTSPANAGNNNWKVVATGDYGVGPGGQANTLDIVWRNGTSGKLVVWYMNTSGSRTNGTFTSPDAPDNPLDWNVVGPK